MNISILMPSRGRPDKAKAAIDKLLALAHHPELVEVIIRIDQNDPRAGEYAALAGGNILVVAGESYGYMGIWRYFEECFKCSSGQVLVEYIDDAEMKTKWWDAVYLGAAKQNPMAAISCRVTGDTFRWAITSAPRKLYPFSMIPNLPDQSLGLTPGKDRVWAAYAEASGNEIMAEVVIEHTLEPSPPGSTRSNYMQDVQDNWGRWNERWTEAGKHMAELQNEKSNYFHDDKPANRGD